ncbi:MAG TPA: SOS response-associated peptidase [Fimbriimonas sp.]|nr:SOS response-associated peptidase [Fimbriimonas sp.]
MCIRYDIANDQLVTWSTTIGAWVPLEDRLAGTDTYQGYEAPIVILEGAKKQLRIAHWNLIPSWTDDPNFGKKNSTFNARSEGSIGRGGGIQNTPSFRDAFRKRRCLVPVSGYYEQENGHWQRVTMPGEPVFAVAGLWEPPKFTPVPTYTMVTTVPNDLIATVQDRMPVVLKPEDYDVWMDLETPLEVLQSIMQPLPSSLFSIEQREPSRKKPLQSGTPSLFDD